MEQLHWVLEPRWLALKDAPQIDISPDAQTSVQVNTNEAAVVGHGNFIDQNADTN